MFNAEANLVREALEKLVDVESHFTVEAGATPSSRLFTTRDTAPVFDLRP